MNLKPSHIVLNGQKVAVDGLFQKATPRTEWETEFYTFLKEWYSESKLISVQSSGSTGTPKKIQLKKDFIAASALRTIEFFKLQANDSVLHCLPSKYIAGKLMVVRAIIAKLNLILIDPASDFKFSVKHSFRFAAMVPTQVSKFIDSKNLHIEQLLIGGDAISPSLENRLQHIGTSCYSSYGMTETATHIAIRKLNGTDADSYYRCLPGISVDLSENNCLRIDMSDVEGSTLQTTDIAQLTNETRFRILGRADNIIISGGIKFSPEIIEQKLLDKINFPFMVSSEPHETLGKQLILLLETEYDTELEKQMELILEAKLDKFERPRRISFTKNLKRTPTGKLKRN